MTTLLAVVRAVVSIKTVAPSPSIQISAALAGKPFHQAAASCHAPLPPAHRTTPACGADGDGVSGGVAGGTGADGGALQSGQIRRWPDGPRTRRARSPIRTEAGVHTDVCTVTTAAPSISTRSAEVGKPCCHDGGSRQLPLPPAHFTTCPTPGADGGDGGGGDGVQSGPMHRWPDGRITICAFSANLTAAGVHTDVSTTTVPVPSSQISSASAGKPLSQALASCHTPLPPAHRTTFEGGTVHPGPRHKTA